MEEGYFQPITKYQSIQDRIKRLSESKSMAQSKSNTIESANNSRDIINEKLPFQYNSNSNFQNPSSTMTKRIKHERKVSQYCNDLSNYYKFNNLTNRDPCKTKMDFNLMSIKQNNNLNSDSFKYAQSTMTMRNSKNNYLVNKPALRHKIDKNNDKSCMSFREQNINQKKNNIVKQKNKLKTQENQYSDSILSGNYENFSFDICEILKKQIPKFNKQADITQESLNIRHSQSKGNQAKPIKRHIVNRSIDNLNNLNSQKPSQSCFQKIDISNNFQNELSKMLMKCKSGDDLMSHRKPGKIRRNR